MVRSGVDAISGHGDPQVLGKFSHLQVEFQVVGIGNHFLHIPAVPETDSVRSVAQILLEERKNLIDDVVGLAGAETAGALEDR